MREYSETKVSSSLIGVAAGMVKWEGTSFFLPSVAHGASVCNNLAAGRLSQLRKLLTIEGIFGIYFFLGGDVDKHRV